jgi:DNA-binding HxlR family transcriptional regulator
MFYYQYIPITSKSQALTSKYIYINSNIEFRTECLYTVAMETQNESQFHALVNALEIVGGRWTLLIILELLAGPRRFKDLLEGLPGISTNLLSQRLKSLEQQGIVCRRVLPPPMGSNVYELTTAGKALQQALHELGDWGSHFLPDVRKGDT